MYKLVDPEDVLPKSREYYINKAMKLKALADSGYQGEQDVATNLLAELMQKYEITWSDLDDSIERDYIFPCENEYQKRLLVQITYTHVGQGHCYRMYSSEAKDDEDEFMSIKVRCRPRDFLDIKLDWEFYWMKFEEELDIFYRAFVEKNHLFPPETLQTDEDHDDNEELSEEEIRKIQGMMNGIDTYTRHSRLEEHKED